MSKEAIAQLKRIINSLKDIKKYKRGITKKDIDQAIQCLLNVVNDL